MTRPIALAALAGLALTGLALADDTPKKAPPPDEAQAKVDAAKVRTCEKGKQFLAEQKAKGTCVAEADEAAKVTCSPQTSKQVSDLMTRCTSAKR